MNPVLKSIAGRGRKAAIGLGRAAMGARAPLPRFLIIGTERGGTTSLFQMLRRHPQIATPYNKELNFFASLYPLGPRWYRAMLDRNRHSGDDALVTFEASPRYFAATRVPGRIAEMLPEAKLILLLRDPARRAVSSFHHHFKNFKGPPPSIERRMSMEMDLVEPYLDRPWQDISDHVLPRLGSRSFVPDNLYGHILAHWLNHIPRERFLIIRSEDMFADQNGTLARVLRFVDLPAFEPAKPIHVNAGTYSPTDPEIYRRLADFFAKANRRLPELAGDEFHWD